MKIKIKEWAKLHYNPCPTQRTLRIWATSGQIFPSPEKVGQHGFMVEENAVRVPLPEVCELAGMSDRAKQIMKIV